MDELGNAPDNFVSLYVVLPQEEKQWSKTKQKLKLIPLELYSDVAHLLALISLTMALTRPPSKMVQSWWGRRKRTP